jgi:glycerol uptake facilitator-like aquaporin
MEGVGKTNR